MAFEDFVGDSVTRGEIVFDPHMHIHTTTTEAMLKYIALQQSNRIFIYNYEDSKYYYFCDNKLYRLNFEIVKI